MAFSLRSAWKIRSTIFVVMAALTLATAPTVSGGHLTGVYPNRGFVWLNHWYNGTIQVTSDNCNPRETDAFAGILAGTAGTAEFANHWRDGIRLVREPNNGCTGVVTPETDIRITYQYFNQDWWGKNFHTKAPPAWCAMMDDAYPQVIDREDCGSHHELIKIDRQDWDSPPGGGISPDDAKWQEKLIVHETGHSLGLNHLCPQTYSVMCDTNLTHWADVMTWQPVDRQHYINVYPEYDGG